MTKSYNPRDDEPYYGGQEAHVAVSESQWRKLLELRATCMDAPLNLGFLARRIKAMGMMLVSADLMAYADQLKRMAEAADDQSTSREDQSADPGSSSDAPSPPRG